MNKVIIKLGDTTIRLTASEFTEIVDCTRAQIRYGLGGLYGDGDKIINKTGLKTAQSAIKKIEKALTN